LSFRGDIQVEDVQGTLASLATSLSVASEDDSTIPKDPNATGKDNNDENMEEE
jgi:hypothetical protein